MSEELNLIQEQGKWLVTTRQVSDKEADIMKIANLIALEWNKQIAFDHFRTTGNVKTR